MKWASLFLLAIVVACTAVSAWALNPDRTIHQYNCRTWRRDNGLPVKSVNSIAIAQDGRVWLGTSQGLVSFDGVEFHVLGEAGKFSIQGRVVTTVAAHVGGGIWYGLDNGGYGFSDGKVIKPIAFPSWVRTEATVRMIREASDGRVYVGGTSGVGRSESQAPLEQLLPNSVDVFSIFEDPTGCLWFGTAENGVYSWQHGKMTPFPDPELSKSIIQAVATDSHGRLWLATSNGVIAYDAQHHRLPMPPLPPVKTLFVDRHDVLWIGTYGGGIFRYRDGVLAHFNRSDGLASDDVLSFAESRDGSLWIGTSDGLTQLSDLKFPMISRADGLVYDSALCVVSAPDDTLWIGTPNGFSCYKDGHFSNFGTDKANGLSSVWVKRIYPTKNGDAYLIGGQKNIDHFVDGRVVESWPCDVWPRDVTEDDQSVIFALGRQLRRLENGRIVPYLLKNGTVAEPGWINSILMGPDKTLWLATEDGLFCLKDGILTDLCQKNGLPKVRYDYLTFDDEGNLWSAQHHGIARCKNGQMSVITHDQGLHEDYVYAIVPDRKGNFWFDSNHGIFRASQAELNAVADGRGGHIDCAVFEGPDAVKTTDKVSIEYSGARTRDGRVWFPTTKGVVMIDPDNIPDTTSAPPVSINNIRVNGRPYQPGEGDVIEPGPGNLEFQYSALEYIAPEKIQYRYRLVGLDTDWVPAGNRRAAFYTNLPPGTYRFEVQASDTDSDWITGAESVTLRLPPRYFETLAFRLTGAILLLGSGFYLAWMRRVHRTKVELEKANALMEEKVKERTTELRAEIDVRTKAQQETERLHDQLRASADAAQAAVKAKSQFLANMSHEIRTPMNAVIGMSNLLLETSLDSHQHELAETTRNSAEALLTVLNDILDFSKMEAGKLNLESLDFNLSDAIEESLELMTVRAGEKGVELSSLIEHDLPRRLRGDPTRLRQVLLNLLGNAVKFTAKGEILVTAKREPASDPASVTVRFEIHDSGIGISEQAQRDLFKPFTQADNSTTRRFGGTGLGLAISQQIVTLMGGSIGVHSVAGRGSTFWFVIPFQTADAPHPGPAAVPPAPAGLRLLLLHHSPAVERVVRHHAANWGVEIARATDLAEAARLAAEAAAAGRSFHGLLTEPADGPQSKTSLTAPAVSANGIPLRAVLVTTLQSARITALAPVPEIVATVPTPIRTERLRRAFQALAGSPPAPRPEPSGTAAAPTQSPFQPGLRILVAEDNIVNQRVVQLQLRKAGFDAQMVANGLEVLSAVEKQPFDVIFMDCQMPELDGYETTRRLRQQPSTRDIFVIAMTANSLDGDRERCLAAGMDAYLSKPTRERDIVAALELTRKPRRPASPANAGP